MNWQIRCLTSATLLSVCDVHCFTDLQLRSECVLEMRERE